MGRTLLLVFFVQAVLLQQVLGRARSIPGNAKPGLENNLEKMLQQVAENNQQKNFPRIGEEEVQGESEETKDRFSFVQETCQYEQTKAIDREKLFGGRIVTHQSMTSWFVVITHQTDSGNDERVCGGTMISNKLVLTAAHCFGIIPTHTGIDKACREKMGRYSAAVWGSKGRRIQITKVYVPKNYKQYLEPSNLVSADVAVAVLSKNIASDFTRPPLCFLHKEHKIHAHSHRCLALGIGYTDKSENEKPNSLMELVTHVNSCRNKLPGARYIKHIKCINEGPLKGDSGGPVICKPKSANQYYVSGVIAQQAEGRGAIITDMTAGGCQSWLKNIIRIAEPSNENCEDEGTFRTLGCGPPKSTTS